jgi:hypothetical protein
LNVLSFGIIGGLTLLRERNRSVRAIRKISLKKTLYVLLSSIAALAAVYKSQEKIIWEIIRSRKGSEEQDP